MQVQKAETILRLCTQNNGGGGEKNFLSKQPCSDRINGNLTKKVLPHSKTETIRAAGYLQSVKACLLLMMRALKQICESEKHVKIGKMFSFFVVQVTFQLDSREKNR